MDCKDLWDILGLFKALNKCIPFCFLSLMCRGCGVRQTWLSLQRQGMIPKKAPSYAVVNCHTNKVPQ